jgi:ParB family transcriptional regulator, chromosome partitioning protein
MSAKKRGLGRGLDGLISEMPRDEAPPATNSAAAGQSEVEIAEIERNPWQPRKRFDEQALQELVASVSENGVLQPLLVRKKDRGYELIAGERRLRAATEAGLKKVPVRIMEIDDEKALEIAMVENLQREDLNPIEEAQGYQLLMESFGLGQEAVAQRVGKARATVTNALRLLRLDPQVQQMVSDGRISGGHAKILAGFEIAAEQRLLAEAAAKQGMSVRQLEQEAARRKRPPRKPRAFKSDIPTTHLNDLQDQLKRQLGTSVKIEPSRTLSNGKRVKGRIEIDFFDSDELDRLLVMLGIQDIV